MSKIVEKEKVNLFYFNNIIKNYSLPESFKDLKTDIKNLFNIDSRLNKEIFVYYKLLKENKDIGKEKYIEVKSDEDYQMMKKYISNDSLDKTLLIEIRKNINDDIRKVSEKFEDEIKIIVENELRNAGERIKQYLSSYSKKYYPSSKIQDKICDDCKEIICGDIYKNALKIEEKFYCEQCSFKINDPMFVIH